MAGIEVDMKRCFTESFKKLDEDFLTEARQKYEAEAGLQHFIWSFVFFSFWLSVGVCSGWLTNVSTAVVHKGH